ncbi:1-(5-phosphoribosyl)-5-[(5- phosphoribosylamino)methylideneamino] imidazole-4-carboxamide isomerase [Candidatus Hodgkinia cicadicola]|uniref:1-(5-phosphoribosyl)-5-[(5-phosphoribosylamino)methylideneamino] imidazole-4-carboxamide isomerase n=1 Tax=Candidatus Hodgkinia cicadicola TaxID=573658 RepID=A0ABX4MH69_9HYPH|nr:1-(5-phosphoribosyl)-5-[(5- phosphoribosylamino)methylideneamino] imidazole-4-carboxamide isomerase [Candidatus Hodgkinia cicadicola]PIM96249.1 1-(5-phosphoribosyl)-5-[(5- phosphoribosylamino)methylideneamino] imidazole-4-carboxamide isomerase [Candidatus Hodgkinia cicadicola]
MIYIPAIDIKDNKCVRLYKGDMNRYKVYKNSPTEVIDEFQLQTLSTLHIVDLDGAVCGKPKNFRTIKEFVDLTNCNIQLGGGIRTMDTLERYFDIGVTKVILGTSVLSDMRFLSEACYKYPGRICVSIDTLNGMILDMGWTNNTGRKDHEIIEMIAGFNISFIVWTDINRDGVMEGINTTGLLRVINKSRLPVVVSGGVTNVADLIFLRNNLNDSLAGVICGRALYEGSISIDIIKQLEDD